MLLESKVLKITFKTSKFGYRNSLQTLYSSNQKMFWFWNLTTTVQSLNHCHN